MGAAESKQNPQEMLFNLKMTSKQLMRQSKQAEKDMNSNKKKAADYLARGNMDAARIYGETVISKKQLSISLLRLSSRIDGVASRLQSAAQMNQLSHSLGVAVKGMDKAMSSMNLEQMQRVMDDFESKFEELDVRTQTLESGMSAATMSAVPQDDVESLMQEIATEHGLEVASELGSATRVHQQDQVAEEDDALSRRLAALRQ